MTWSKDVIITFLIMAAGFSLPAFLMGLGYPLICKSVTRELGTLGREVGKVYAIGTAGGILGSLAAAFVLLPLLGLQRSTLLLSAVALGCGYLAIRGSALQGRARLAPRIAAIVLIVGSIGLELSATDIGLGSARGGQTVFAKEGVMGTVRVTREQPGGPLKLLVNNYQLAQSADIAVRYGHIPLILKPQAKDVLLISLGAGIKDPRLALTFWDGRHFVRVTRRKYDLIIADLFQPDSAGVGSLYALEHYQQARTKLTPGGAMAQWLPMYQLSPENLRVVMRTFAEAFEHVTVWYGDFVSEMPALLLLGSNEPLAVEFGSLSNALDLPLVRADMIEHSDALSFLSAYITDRDGIMELTAGAPINSDDNPVIEYSAPHDMWSRTTDAVVNFESLIGRRESFTKLVPNDAKDEEFQRWAAKYFDARTKILEAKVEHAHRDYNAELDKLKEAARFAEHDPVLAAAALDLGYLFVENGEYETAVEILQWSLRVNPDLLLAKDLLAKAQRHVKRRPAAP